MSMLQKFDYLQFKSKSKDKVFVENISIENCIITGIQCGFLTFLKCSFKNVVFENSLYEVYTCMENCEFVDCKFHDNFEGNDLELVIRGCTFSDCLFENISYNSIQVQSNIINCKMINCNFKKIQIEGDLCFIGLEISGGKVEDFRFTGNQILANEISNMQIKDANLNVALIKNKMENVIFENVILKGYDKENTFTNCDKSGFTFIQDY